MYCRTVEEIIGKHRPIAVYTIEKTADEILNNI